MEDPIRILTSLDYKNLQDDIFNVIKQFGAHHFFNYIDPNLLNVQTEECINFGNDTIGLAEHYISLDIYHLDPFLNQFKHTRKQTFHFKELELSQIKMPNSQVRVGVMLNQERSRLFKVHNGIYRTIQINPKYCLVCLYGQEKKDFSFDIDFDPTTYQGKWFQRFELALIEVVHIHLNNIDVMKRVLRCPISKEY